MSDSFSTLGVKTQLDNCTFCPKLCRHACPVSTASARESEIPQAKMARLNRLRRGELRWDHDNTDSLWACTGCRHCTVYCEHDNEPGLVLFAGRAEANARGLVHKNLEGYPERFRSRDQRLIGELEERISADSLATEGSVGYWPGCDAIDKSPRDIQDAIALFDKLGQEHARVIQAGQACAGYPLLAAGYPDMFRWHASKVAESIKGFEKVVVGCSACLYTLRVQYPAEGISVAAELTSLAEYLADHASELPTCRIGKPIVYYHDPCYLARYSGVIEQPRRLLAQLADVREFGWSKEDAECCGGAGVLPKTMPKVADDMARRRLRDVASRGGGIVVTSCPTCAFMLKSNAPDGVEVLDLPQAVRRLAMGDTE